ncbi:hypothetical protein NtB2_01173 [Lactococcus termiticola]|uniref:Uncharacterized protein n=1 Tax=Lactococcus termiticola TaxID=2169526 RepID=A0A2R5HGP7_9LACT|nr:hypothetical protein NtB2_01173 [Lactococcus termiticola]
MRTTTIRFDAETYEQIMKLADLEGVSTTGFM